MCLVWYVWVCMGIRLHAHKRTLTPVICVLPLQCVAFAACCSCSVLQLQCVAAAVCCNCSVWLSAAVCCRVQQSVAVCCSVLPCVAVCCHVLPCVALCWQCAAVCHSVMQRIVSCVLLAMYTHAYIYRRKVIYTNAGLCFLNPRIYTYRFF